MIELSKMLMYEFWYDYVKSKYGEKTKFLYEYIKTNDIYKEIAEDAETRFDTWVRFDTLS